MKLASLILILASGFCFAQKPLPPKAQVKPPSAEQETIQEGQKKRQQIISAEKDGVEVRIKGIAHFRGIRSNQLMGTGLVVGLSGSGDSKRSVITQQIISNMFKEFGIRIDPSLIDMKNIAAVMVTADLPPFATNGQLIDVQVASIGDAKSLVGGTLLQTPMYAIGDQSTVYVTAQGSLNLGGYDVSSGGSSAQKNFVTAGRLPEGGIVERGAPTKLMDDRHQVFLELNQADLTTAKINENFPNLNAIAQDGGTIAMTVPLDLAPMEAMSRIEELSVFADSPETIVINEKTGTIVIGGNVRIGPAAIVHGNLSVKIDQDIRVIQPNEHSNGQTKTQTNTTIKVDEPTADVASLAPNTTVADLARVFLALQLKASDVISILEALRTQGALKARIITQ